MFHKQGSSLGVGPNKKKSMDVPLKKSDRRALKQAAVDMLMIDDTHREPCNSILQSAFVSGDLLKRKLSLPEGKVMLYTRNPSDSEENGWPYHLPQVIWMSLDDGSKWIHAPTLALLSLLPPYSFPTVEVPSAVSKFLCRGAHLMRAGMRSMPPKAVNGIVTVTVKGNPQPMAVGRVMPGTSVKTIGIDSKGVGVEIWTCYGDDLWRSQATSCVQENSVASPMGGAPFDEGNYGNVGFIEGKYVMPIVASEGDESDSEEQGEQESNADQENEPNGATEQEVSAVEQPSAAQETEPETNTAENLERVDVNPNDVALHDAFCKALALVNNSDLPMTTANFYSQHVLSQSSTPIQIKKTSYKKLGVYLAEQMERNLLTCGPDKDRKDPMAYITSVNRRHPDLLPYGQGQKESASSSTKRKMAIVNLFMIPHHFASLLRLDQDDVKAANAKSPERRSTGMLTAPEARAILDKYIAKNELLDTIQPDQVKVDGPLCDALYRKQKGNYPTQVSRKELNTEWLKKMEPAYALVEMPGSKIAALSRGTPPTVSIEVSMRQGKKFITRVRGLEAFGIDGTEFSKDVAKRFACSATVETNPAGRAALKKGNVELVFQGHLVEELRALLLGDESLTSHGGAKGGDYCLPKNVIDVTLKKGVPAKKRR